MMNFALFFKGWLLLSFLMASSGCVVEENCIVRCGDSLVDFTGALTTSEGNASRVFTSDVSAYLSYNIIIPLCGSYPSSEIFSQTRGDIWMRTTSSASSDYFPMGKYEPKSWDFGVFYGDTSKDAFSLTFYNSKHEARTFVFLVCDIRYSVASKNGPFIEVLPKSAGIFYIHIAMAEACRTTVAPTRSPTTAVRTTTSPSLRQYSDDMWNGKHQAYKNDDVTRSNVNALYGLLITFCGLMVLLCIGGVWYNRERTTTPETIEEKKDTTPPAPPLAELPRPSPPPSPPAVMWPWRCGGCCVTTPPTMTPTPPKVVTPPPPTAATVITAAPPLEATPAMKATRHQTTHHAAPSHATREPSATTTRDMVARNHMSAPPLFAAEEVLPIATASYNPTSASEQTYLSANRGGDGRVHLMQQQQTNNNVSVTITVNMNTNGVWEVEGM